MKLSMAPWKTAWHDRQVSERFFQELSKTEKSLAKDLETSGQWVEHLLIEFGQLAQNMVQLETDDPHLPQLRLAYERAIKLSSLTTHLALALNENQVEMQSGNEPDAYHPSVESAVAAATHQAEVGGMAPETAEEAESAPMKRTVRSLADRGVSLEEIEVITGHSRQRIVSILAEE